MTCNIRIVAENAKIQFAFLPRGLAPELGSHVIVPCIAGPSLAADLLLSGRMTSGREMARLGWHQGPFRQRTCCRPRWSRPESIEKRHRCLWLSPNTCYGRDSPPPLRKWMSLNSACFGGSAVNPMQRKGLSSFLRSDHRAGKCRPPKTCPIFWTIPIDRNPVRKSIGAMQASFALFPSTLIFHFIRRESLTGAIFLGFEFVQRQKRRAQ